MSATITGRHLLAGRWLDKIDKPFDSRSPAQLKEVVGTFPTASPDLAAEAVAAARTAFPGWKRTSRIKRAELFDILAQLVKRDTDSLALLMARACG